jgi:hypothetical protein
MAERAQCLAQPTRPRQGQHNSARASGVAYARQRQRPAANHFSTVSTTLFDARQYARTPPHNEGITEYEQMRDVYEDATQHLGT